MQKNWTARGIKGKKFLIAAGFFILAREPMLALVPNLESHLVKGIMLIIFGVVGPILGIILFIAGLVLISTQHK